MRRLGTQTRLLDWPPVRTAESAANEKSTGVKAVRTHQSPRLRLSRRPPMASPYTHGVWREIQQSASNTIETPTALARLLAKRLPADHRVSKSQPTCSFVAAPTGFEPVSPP